MTSRSCVFAGSSILMAAACAVAPRPVQSPAHGAASLERGGSTPPEAGSDERGGSTPPEAGSDERGMAVDSAPLTLQIGLRVRGSKDGPLNDGDTIVKGDRIQVFAQPTEDVHLYLAYCAANGGLTVFPAHGSIFSPAGATTVAPGQAASLLVDDHAGAEALFVILSRADLASADPRLAEAIKAVQPGEPAAECGPRFEEGVTPSSPEEPQASDAEPAPDTRSVPARPGDGSRRPPRASQHKRPSIGSGAAPGAKPGPGTPRATRPTDRAIAGEKRASPDVGVRVGPVRRGPSSAAEDERPLVTIERGMRVSQDGFAEVTVDADANGIVILQYRFKHVAVPRP